MSIIFNPIGIIHSPFTQKENMPIQTSGGKGIKGHIEIFPEYIDGLRDLDEFSHIYLIYQFHLSKGCDLLCKPFLDDKKHGVFAVRSPRRPNQIGLSIVRLIDIQGGILNIEDMDIIDGTPLIDIKPYIPKIDCRKAERIGWLEDKAKNFKSAESDERFGK
ncbi:MAG: tRNA (N6-threonylcarbamoyladenosine(37)-N6)-methyltransferase TrmO [Chlorobi bacterium]|nr:tRNA (N6-threonylcarbamoyladenosine(37)-N6)-methyltransferase TrmO [Chlorobiota bacterium]